MISDIKCANSDNQLLCNAKLNKTSPPQYTILTLLLEHEAWVGSLPCYSSEDAAVKGFLNSLSHTKWWKGDANQEHIDSISTCITHYNNWPMTLYLSPMRTIKQWKLGLLVIPVSPLTQTHSTAHSRTLQAVLREMLIKELNQKKKNCVCWVKQN